MSKVPKVISSPIVRKEYSYKIGGCILNFTLRQDNTQELLYFKQILQSAMVDVDKDIKNFRN